MTPASSVRWPNSIAFTMCLTDRAAGTHIGGDDFVLILLLGGGASGAGAFVLILRLGGGAPGAVGGPSPGKPNVESNSCKCCQRSHLGQNVHLFLQKMQEIEAADE